MYLQSLRTNLYDLHWESEAEKNQGMEMGSVVQEGLESCEVILIRKVKIGKCNMHQRSRQDKDWKCKNSYSNGKV